MTNDEKILYQCEKCAFVEMADLTDEKLTAKDKRIADLEEHLDKGLMDGESSNLNVIRELGEVNDELEEKLKQASQRIAELVDNIFIIKRLAMGYKSEVHVWIDDLPYLPDDSLDEAWEDLEGVIKEALQPKDEA